MVMLMEFYCTREDCLNKLFSWILPDQSSNTEYFSPKIYWLSLLCDWFSWRPLVHCTVCSTPMIDAGTTHLLWLTLVIPIGEMNLPSWFAESPTSILLIGGLKVKGFTWPLCYWHSSLKLPHIIVTCNSLTLNKVEVWFMSSSPSFKLVWTCYSTLIHGKELLVIKWILNGAGTIAQ